MALMRKGDANKGIEVVVAAHEDAKKRGLGKGRGGSGEFPCPACGTGTVHYSVASVNGHIHAGCTTEGCIRFME
jgi:hypothetical protein